MKGFSGKILFFSVVAVGIIASSVWGPPDTLGKKLPSLLVTKKVLVEYVEDRLSQLERKEKPTEEQVAELNFIRQNRNNLQKLAKFYDMEIKEARRDKNPVGEEQPASEASERPLRNSSQSDSIIDASQLRGEKAPSDAPLTKTSEPEQASVSSEFDRKIDEGKRPRQVQDKRAGEDRKVEEKVTVLKEASLPPVTSEASISAQKSWPSHLSHLGTLEGASASKHHEALSERGLPHPLTTRKSSIEPEEQTAQLSPSSLTITEEEVRELLSNYVENYTQKDINGFLSLFSPRCVQNRRDGFEEIEKIYSHFFDQSQEIRYRLENIDIRIYEKGGLVFGRYYFHVAEVRARYQMDQILKKKGKHKVWRGEISWILVRENEDLRILSTDYQHQKG